MTTIERFCIHCGAGNFQDAGRCFSCGHSLRVTIPLAKEANIAGTHVQGRYRLLEQIGQGGYSAVYRAEDMQEKRIVALKATSLRDLTPQEQIEATDTFNREVHFLSNLHQKNLPQVYEYFSEQECWYLVMEYIPGITLEQRLEQLKGQPLALNEALEIGLVLCNVLAYLHNQEPKIIFRDLKPGNIMLTLSGQVYLIDFGIARRHKPGKAHDTIPFGSPGYAAPEQYGRTQTAPTADIYSLGAILHQLVTGKDPTEQAFQFEPLASPEQQELSELLMSMVELDISKRPQQIEQVQQRLTEIEQRLRLERGLHSLKVGSNNAATSISYAPPSPTQGNLYPGQSTTTTAIYAANGQVQVIHQQNQYYQGPIAPGVPRRNFYATFSVICCVLALILPVISCTMSSAFLPMPSFLSMLGSFAWMIFALLGPGLGGIVFGILGQRQARRYPHLLSTLKSARNSLIISSIFFTFYLAVCFFLLYNIVASPF